jgi:hypothetical protein
VESASTCNCVYIRRRRRRKAGRGREVTVARMTVARRRLYIYRLCVDSLRVRNNTGIGLYIGLILYIQLTSFSALDWR